MESTEQSLVAQVLSWVQEHNLNAEQKDVGIDQDTDLLSAGILDSIAFIGLITFIEGETGHQIDIAEADPEEFVTIAGLCKFALKAGP